MSAAMIIIIVALVAIIVAALVLAGPRIAGRRRPGQGQRSSRRPPAGERPGHTGFRGESHREAEERVLLAEGEEIQRRVEAQVARDRAGAHRRFRANGPTAANQLESRQGQDAPPPPFPGTGYPVAEPDYGHPGIDRDPSEPGYAYPGDRSGDPRVGRSRSEIPPGDDYSAEVELREAAARARAARMSSASPPPHGRRRLWPVRPRSGPGPAPVDRPDDRFVP